MSEITHIKDHEPPLLSEDSQFQATVSAVVAAFGDPTRREIYLFVRDNTGVTANQVASIFSLHPNVARHHLDKLVAGGYLDVYLEKAAAGGAGRPSKKYIGASITSDASNFSKKDDLMSMLLTATLEQLNPLEAEQLAQRVGEAYGKTLASAMHPKLAHRSIKFAMRAIADALTAHGFAAHQLTGSEKLTIISENCPFGSAAVANPVICALESGLVRGMLKTLVREPVPVTSTSRAKGDACCTVMM